MHPVIFGLDEACYTLDSIIATRRAVEFAFIVRTFDKVIEIVDAFYALYRS